MSKSCRPYDTRLARKQPIHPPVRQKTVGHVKVYHMTQMSHDVEELYKLAVNYFNRRVWNADQRTALLLLKQWLEVWPGPSGGVEPMQRAIECISHIFFLGKLGDVTFEWDDKLIEMKHMNGVTDWPRKEDGSHYIHIVMDTRKRRTLDKGTTRKTELLGTLFHEITHGFLELYACDGRCATPTCAKASKELVGETGHGRSWLTLAHAIERVCHKYLNLDISVGLCNATMHEYRESKRIPRSAEYDRVLTPSLAAREAASFKDVMNLRVKRCVGKPSVLKPGFVKPATGRRRAKKWGTKLKQLAHQVSKM